MKQTMISGRTYNHLHVPPKYVLRSRRFSVYWPGAPWEANRDVTELDNRFSTMTEVRRVAWPNFESIEYSEKMFLHSIGGPSSSSTCRSCASSYGHGAYLGPDFTADYLHRSVNGSPCEMDETLARFWK